MNDFWWIAASITGLGVLSTLWLGLYGDGLRRRRIVDEITMARAFEKDTVGEDLLKLVRADVDAYTRRRREPDRLRRSLFIVTWIGFLTAIVGLILGFRGTGQTGTVIFVVSYAVSVSAAIMLVIETFRRRRRRPLDRSGDQSRPSEGPPELPPA